MLTACQHSILSKIERAVIVLCQELATGKYLCPLHHLNEQGLRRELISCILGSQVRYETATCVMENLEFCGFFEDHWWEEKIKSSFASKVFAVLSNQVVGLPHSISHRFPHKQAEILVKLQVRLIEGTLSERLSVYSNKPKELRKHLVAELPGVGPKQASMFIRNIGNSYDLAVLDTHILRFFRLMQKPIQQQNLTSLSGYENIEMIIDDYAYTLGCPTGHLDLAVWATMKAARELNI